MRDTVCQIAVSALLYARQLGIQPLGGEKDVEGLVIAESDYGRAEGFMVGMCAVYEVGFAIHHYHWMMVANRRHSILEGIGGRNTRLRRMGSSVSQLRDSSIRYVSS